MISICMYCFLGVYQLPRYNLFTQHVIYLRRATSSELWIPVLFFTYNLQTVYFFPFDTFNPLFSAKHGEIDNLIASWGQSSVVVLCRSPCCYQHLQCALPRLSQQHLWGVSLLLLVRLNLGFITEGNLLLCSSYLPLGVPNELYINTAPALFWRRTLSLSLIHI